jgi:hypothetical protein
LIDRKRGFAGKVEGLYGGKVHEMFKKEQKHSVKNWGLWKAVRKVMGRGVNWEVEWGEEEELVVGVLGRRMVAEEWTMETAVLVKDRRVGGREFTAFVWVSQSSIALEFRHIQPFCLYLDSAKCNLDEHTKPAWVRTCYTCVAQKVQPVPLLD